MIVRSCYVDQRGDFFSLLAQALLAAHETTLPFFQIDCKENSK